MRKLAVNWTAKKVDPDIQILQFRRYLERLGLKENTIKLYTILIRKYLMRGSSPQEFYYYLVSRKYSKSARNNYAASIIK